MYNFNLLVGEKIVKIFDRLLIRQSDKQKILSAVLTNKRLLFFEFVNSNPAETLRTARGVSFIGSKDVIYEISLNTIESVEKDEYYLINLKNSVSFEFEDEELYELLKNEHN
ncbi:MAG TPA: hypothetical protein IAB56_05295 [Candidatus Scybalousia intestinigallinarum]|nr:hypothetical protein [Candidatus Scybalousia intestinigallinarum]